MHAITAKDKTNLTNGIACISLCSDPSPLPL